MGKLNDLLATIIAKVNASVKTEVQSLTEEEKKQARENIGAGEPIASTTPDIQSAEVGQVVAVESVDDSGKPLTWKPVDVVKTEVQSLTEEEKKQARENIGAGELSDKDYMVFKDAETGYRYVVEMRNGSLASSLMAVSIAITTPPNKTSYVDGEEIDVTGMVVEAILDDGSSQAIVDYTYTEVASEEGLLTVGWDYLGREHTTSIELNVVPSLVDFEYLENDDDTYEVIAWKGTLNGETSTEIVVPDSPLIVI